MDLGLVGKNVIITGGSRGIGRATALEFAAEGTNVPSAHAVKQHWIALLQSFGRKA